MVSIDVLHALDLGCSQDILGNIIWHFMNSGCCPGHNLVEKVQAVYNKLKVHYTILGSQNRLQNLTLEMVRRDGKGPRLRAKGR